MVYKSIDEVKYTFQNVEEYIEFVLSSVHINDGATNQITLKDLTECLGDGIVEVDWTRAMYVLRKYNQ